MIKKILIEFKNDFITEFNSDTFLGYIFYYWFDKLKLIYDKFINWEIPFYLTDGFPDWYMIKPLKPLTITWDNDNVKYKNIKKNKFIKIDDIVNYYKMIFENAYYEIDYNIDNPILENIHVWNYINRITNLSTPYYIQTKKIDKIVIYVNIINESDFNNFYKVLKDILLSVWRWKNKSRWFWKISHVDLLDLDEHENNFFTYIKEIYTKEWYTVVLNQYKPLEDEINNFDINSSYIDISFKISKSIFYPIFKWKYYYIKPWSIIKWTNLKWWYYENNWLYNFWYLFNYL